MNPKTVLKFASDLGAKFVSVRFTDLPGSWQHLTFPIGELGEEQFEDGFGFDASSIRGWAAIHESDMLLVPDANRYWMDPFTEQPTLCLIGSAVDPITKEGYAFDPRSVAQRAESYLKFTGLADTAYYGPEAEFFVFDSAKFHNNQNSAGYTIDSDEGHWNSGREADEFSGSNLGYRIRPKEGYVPVSPTDSLVDLRSEISLILAKCGITVECHHHEVATAGQCEIDFRFATLLGTADNLQIFKYVVRNTANQYGKSATFMPKPLYGDNGSGMHCHQSLWKGEKPLFAGDGYAGLSEMARYYIGGLLKHAAAVVAFAAPTTNSYKRLVPGFEAPVNLAIQLAIVQLRFVSRCSRRIRNLNDSSSDRLIHPAMLTWHFQRCYWRVWMVFKTESIQAIHSRKTFTICRPKSLRTFRHCLAHWTTP
jgi:glutamine synthetase